MYNCDELYSDIKNGMSKETFHKKYGGIQLYIPQLSQNYKTNIIKEFNGYNYHILATKYNLSLSSVYRIIREHKKKN